MNCPACGSALTAMTTGDIKVGACKESARKVARIFKFISPSYYIPGKQGWGAF